MKEGYWVIRTYEAGPVGEKTKFWVPGKRPEGKSRRKEKDAIRKQEQNEYAALKAAARILNANFGKGDILLGLDYGEKGMQKLLKWAQAIGIDMDSLSQEERRSVLWEAADHELENCLRRAKRHAKRLGVELKAFYATSDMDPETSEPKRVHHHLVINKEARECFELAWKDMGNVDWKEHWVNQKDWTPVAEYILKQVRKIPNGKKFRTTRNLVRPVPKDRAVLSDAELRVPKGGKLLYRNAFTKPGQAQYIRYELPQRKTAELWEVGG